MFKFERFAHDEGSGGKIRLDMMADLCDKLGLHLLMNSNDMSFHFKFQDVINDTFKNYLDDGEGCISFEKFKKWWNMDTNELLLKDVPPPAADQPADPAKK